MKYDSCMYSEDGSTRRYYTMCFKRTCRMCEEDFDNKCPTCGAPAVDAGYHRCKCGAWLSVCHGHAGLVVVGYTESTGIETINEDVI